MTNFPEQLDIQARLREIDTIVQQTRNPDNRDKAVLALICDVIAAVKPERRRKINVLHISMSVDGAGFNQAIDEMEERERELLR